jgi:hypothetical protein
MKINTHEVKDIVVRLQTVAAPDKLLSLLNSAADEIKALHDDIEALTDHPRDAPKNQDEIIKAMVSRFLAWKIPESFNPDGGISFDRTRLSSAHPPIGTNLFDFNQATAMVRHMLGHTDPA